MRSFYSEVMGMAIVENNAYPLDEWAELDGKGFKLCLHRAGTPGSGSDKGNKLVFQVDDVGKAREYLVGRRVKMGTHHHWDQIDACDGRDPEGNAFQISGPATAAG